MWNWLEPYYLESHHMSYNIYSQMNENKTEVINIRAYQPTSHFLVIQDNKITLGRTLQYALRLFFESSFRDLVKFLL